MARKTKSAFPFAAFVPPPFVPNPQEVAAEIRKYIDSNLHCATQQVIKVNVLKDGTNRMMYSWSDFGALAEATVKTELWGRLDRYLKQAEAAGPEPILLVVKEYAEDLQRSLIDGLWDSHSTNEFSNGIETIRREHGRRMLRELQGFVRHLTKHVEGAKAATANEPAPHAIY